MDYLNYFQLKEDPFGLTPDSSFFFPSKMHNEALSSLDYAVEQKEGFSLIAGEPGTGKTTILKIFIDRWRERAEIALIMTPRLSPEELLQAVLEDFSIKVESSNKNDLIKAFRDFLIERSMTGRRVIIIVDEAQNLSDESLEELRLLSNLETEKEKLLQIILVGQPEIRQKLHAANLKQLDQRLTVRSYLRPLTLAETIDYVNFRLVKAGKGVASFNEAAIRGMYQFSNGIPRLVNLIASRSMMVAYIASSHTIDKKHVQNAVSHLADVSQARPEPRRWLAYTVGLLLVLSLAVGSVILFKLFQNRHETGSSATTAQTGAKAASTTAQTGSDQAKPLTATPAGMPPVAEQVVTKTVIVDAARVRSRPSLSSSDGPLLPQGTRVRVIEKLVGNNGGNLWYKVRLADGTEGWIVEYQMEEELRR